MKSEISQPWKVYDEINTVLEYQALKRTHQKKEQMRRYRIRRRFTGIQRDPRSPR